MSTPAAPDRPTIFGHPTALFMLFFAEMWERFSYYGMRALLVLYMLKGFLSEGGEDAVIGSENEAKVVYGAYTALVYMTPFFGGLIADKLLGARRAVVVGGLLMAAGHLVMGFENSITFFTALALLIVGNGFFKPNISTIVGGLYPDGDPRRDGGFTLFYMGINLGAAAAPLLCGLVGETFGWHYGFGLATVGMLVGLAIFVIPSNIARFLTLTGAIVTALSMVLVQNNVFLLGVNVFVAACLAVAGVIAFIAMGREGLKPEDGRAAEPELLRKGVIGPITWEHLTYIGIVLVIPMIAALVWANLNVVIIPEEFTKSLVESCNTSLVLGGTLLHEIARPAGLILLIVGVIAVAYLLYEALRSTKVERDRLFVVLVLMFFSMLFWAFFEQAGTSITLFTDRNVDRITEERVITPDEIGTVVQLRVSQEQLGYAHNGKVFTMDQLDALKNPKKPEGDQEAEAEDGIMEILAEAFTKPPPAIRLLLGMEDEADTKDPLLVDWQVDESHVGMGVGGTEVPASTFQAANPIFILLFGLPFASLWVFLGKRKIEPNTSIKFALGLLQLGLGFGALWYGASLAATDRGMVWMGWLLLGYLLHTTGELCLSPVGLSMVTRLSPKRLVSTVMGGWFLATAFSAYLAAVIATFTSPADDTCSVDPDAKPDGDGAADADAGTAAAAATAPPPPVDDVVLVEVADTDGDAVADADTDASDTDVSDTDVSDTDGPGVVGDGMDTDATSTDTDVLAGVDLGEPLAVPASTEDAASAENAETVATEVAEDTHASVGAKEAVPPPSETVGTYGSVFGAIAIMAIASAILLAALSPILQKWMHTDVADSA